MLSVRTNARPPVNELLYTLYCHILIIFPLTDNFMYAWMFGLNTLFGVYIDIPMKEIINFLYFSFLFLFCAQIYAKKPL